MLRSKSATVFAVASRDLARARDAATQFNIARAYGSYDELFADPEVDAIYNPLPNSLHHRWTLRAAEAGKHVLCEKPIALDAAEARDMVQTCSHAGVLLQEAFMYRFHPQVDELQRLVQDGAIGKPWLVRSAFTFTVTRPVDIRLNAALGGGGLMDVGCYCINISRLLLGEPATVWASAQYEHDVDVLLAGMLQFPGAAIALFDCGLRAPIRQFCEVVGLEGTITLSRPFLPMEDPVTILLRRGEREDRVDLPGANHYSRMIDAFGECVRTGKPPRFPASDAVSNMQVIDALRRSAQAGQVVSVRSV